MMINLKLFMLFLLCIVMVVSHRKARKLATAYHYDITGSETDWWTSGVFYQIYPRSFQDSDGDGNGDLQGIISRLQHLKEAGITGTWLSPIFKSPQVDQGYDISDYYNVDPMYGTTEDLKKLIAKAHELDIKIILDFVPNHTSDKHYWFQLSVNRVKEYEDFYIWHDGYPDKKNLTSRKPPNNWISNFAGSAWKWNEKRNQFYYHAFEYRQPDLNYSNPRVVEGIKKVLTYWLDQGIDGFRVDAVPYLFEDPDLRDEPLAEGYTEYNVNDWSCLDHKYTKDLNKTFDMIYQFRYLVDNYKIKHNTSTKIMMTEAYSPINKTMLYYGSEDRSRKGAHYTFNFNFITYLNKDNFTVDDIIYCIDLWLSSIPKNYTSNWVLGNHDNHRVATRLGKENVDALNMMMAILPGVMVTYNGEEIGMEDGEVTCQQGHDPQAIKNCSSFDRYSRDFERTPYHWDNTTNAGFSKANRTWLPVSKKYLETNLALQRKDWPTSHYGIYKSLLVFRKVFQKKELIDTLTITKMRNNILQILRTRDNREYIFLGNFGNSTLRVNFWKIAHSYQVIVASRGSSYKVGDIVENVVLKGHESLILQNFPAYKR